MFRRRPPPPQRAGRSPPPPQAVHLCHRCPFNADPENPARQRPCQPRATLFSQLQRGSVQNFEHPEVQFRTWQCMQLCILASFLLLTQWPIEWGGWCCEGHGLVISWCVFGFSLLSLIFYWFYFMLIQPNNSWPFVQFWVQLHTTQECRFFCL